MPLWASEFSSIVLVNRQSALARSSLAVAASVLSLLSLALPCRRAFVPGWWATQRRGVEAMEYYNRELTDMELIGGCAEQSAESRWELIPRAAVATRKRGRSGYGMTIFAMAKVNPVSRVRFQLTNNVPLSAPGSRRLRSQGTPSQERETGRCTAPGMKRAHRPTLSLSGGGAEGKVMPASSPALRITARSPRRHRSTEPPLWSLHSPTSEAILPELPPRARPEGAGPFDGTSESPALFTPATMRRLRR
ncbi:hypothetical protein CPLU01_10868 [Colletotrichum plurivorum]|uniref:Uncharacterized protein n=1 Tax=Colletotrichum plurivorum TaxID=2175906 RepID=A0A8H6K458_9PEZI|nr:hypothetical protein CPLU01_10868 [Colletotrichum plurivorum]